jgi:hypothetical protein
MHDNAATPRPHEGETMRKSLSPIVACLLLSGCAAMYPRVEPTPTLLSCDGSKACVVPVNVACSRFYGCRLIVDNDLIVVESDRGKAQDIVWRLVGETQAQFPSNGIVLDNTDFQCRPKPETREFVCTDRHAGFGVFKYRINVTVPQSLFGPRGVPSLDPWIVNR